MDNKIKSELPYHNSPNLPLEREVPKAKAWDLGGLGFVEIMDTTLRDGEQTSNVSFSTQEKLSISRLLLDELGVDRIEVASARVSEGEFKSVQKIAQWATNHGYIDKIEVLGFVDGKSSLEWIRDTGCKVINLLCKGSENHCTHQLRKTVHEHLADIKVGLANAEEMGI